MQEACVWKREETGDRAWFEPKEHPGEDSEHPSVQRVWTFCPYCGKPIEFVGATLQRRDEHG
jgi:hypothetical protein